MALALLVGVVVPRAAAQESTSETTREVRLGPDEEEARAHFQLAQLQFRRGRFLEAAREFERAHELAPRPELLYNVYIAYRDAGEAEASANALRQLLALEQIPRALGRERLEARLEALEREIAERRELEARVAQQEEELRARSQPEPADEPPQAAPATGGGGPWTPGLVIVGAGGAVVVAALAIGGGALALYEDVRGRCDGVVCPPETEGDRATGQALTITSDVLLAIGGAAAGVGLVLALVLRDVEAPVTAACTHVGCAASVRGSF